MLSTRTTFLFLVLAFASSITLVFGGSHKLTSPHFTKPVGSILASLHTDVTFIIRGFFSDCGVDYWKTTNTTLDILDITNPKVPVVVGQHFTMINPKRSVQTFKWSLAMLAAKNGQHKIKNGRHYQLRLNTFPIPILSGTIVVAPDNSTNPSTTKAVHHHHHHSKSNSTTTTSDGTMSSSDSVSATASVSGKSAPSTPTTSLLGTSDASKTVSSAMVAVAVLAGSISLYL